jgi:hypothetical protein
VITGNELRRALADIEAAEKNGFMHCLAVLQLISVGPNISQCIVRYSDLIEKAHPTDGKFDWGRFQGVSRRFKFRNGKLIPPRPAPKKGLRIPKC